MTDTDSASPRWRHDIMNQLGIILGFAELLLDEMDRSDPRRADIQEIATAAQRAHELLQRLKSADEGRDV